MKMARTPCLTTRFFPRTKRVRLVWGLSRRRKTGLFPSRSAGADHQPVNLVDPFSDEEPDTSWKHPPNEARALFHNSRTIGFACERRDGDGLQLVGGGLRICCCWLPLCHGSSLVRALRAIEAIDAVETGGAILPKMGRWRCAMRSLVPHTAARADPPPQLSGI
jgi:hypothetical protein